MDISKKDPRLTYGLFGAVVRGHFPQAYAYMWSDVPIPYPEMVKIGYKYEAAQRKRSHRAKALDRLAVEVAKRYMSDGYTDDSVLLQFIDGIHATARQHRKRSDKWRADLNLWRGCIWGYLIGAAVVCQTHGLSLVRDSVVHIALHRMNCDGVPGSITDVRRLFDELTRHFPITDWATAVTSGSEKETASRESD